MSVLLYRSNYPVTIPNEWEKKNNEREINKIVSHSFAIDSQCIMLIFHNKNNRMKKKLSIKVKIRNDWGIDVKANRF